MNLVLILISIKFKKLNQNKSIGSNSSTLRKRKPAQEKKLTKWEKLESTQIEWPMTEQKARDLKSIKNREMLELIQELKNHYSKKLRVQK